MIVNSTNFEIQPNCFSEMSAKLPLFHYNLTDEKSFECKYCNYQAKQYNQLGMVYAPV